MGMRPPHNDSWPPYKRIRFVLVRREPWTMKPWQGLVVAWQKTSRGFKAQVVYVDDDPPQREGKVCKEWFPAELLTPVRVDPNVIDEGQDLPRWRR